MFDPNRFRREVILVCNVSADIPTYFASLRLVVDRHMPIDGCSWFTFEPATVMPTSHIQFRSVPPEQEAAFLAHEATGDDVARFLKLAQDKPHVANLADAADGHPEASTRFREFLEPNGIRHEIRVAFRADGATWGGVALYRRGDPRFSPPEAKALTGVVEYLGQATQRAILTSILGREAEGAGRPGLIVLGTGNRLDSMSPEAYRWLDGLGVDLSDAESVVLPPEVFAAVGHARRTGTGHFDQGPSVVPAKTGEGDELVLHAALLDADPQGEVAVIVDVARPLRLPPAIASAYGLAEDDIERARTDAELRSRIFAEHFAPRLEKGDPPGPDGFFGS